MAPRILVADSQEINSFQKCPWHYYLKFSKNWRKGGETPMPLERGNLGHTILDTFYNCLKVNVPFEDAIEAAATVGRELYVEMDLDIETCEWVITSFYQYANRWKYDGIKVIEVEQPAMFLLHEEEDLKIYYATKIDLLAEFPLTGRGPMDHKWRGVRAEYNKLDNQFIGYAVASNADIVYINEVGLQKSKEPADKFRRIPLSYDKGIKERWIKNTIWWAKQMDWAIQNETFPQCHTTVAPQGITQCVHCEFNNICASSNEQEMNRKIVEMYRQGEAWDVTAALVKD